MKGRSKALAFFGCLAATLAGGVLLLVGIVVLANRHLPSSSLLAFELNGSIPEASDDTLFADLLGPQPISRRDLRDALGKAAHDPSVRAVRVKVGDVNVGFATAQEIRDGLIAVAKAGKPTTAYLETAGEGSPGNRAYFLASACQKVVLAPLGDLNVLGFDARVPFIRGTLDKLGIEPEFLGIGDYKTARFFFTEKGLTPADREMTTWLLTSIASQVHRGIAATRKLDESAVRELMARGPYSGEEARDRHLVDEIAEWPDLVAETEKLDGADLSVVSLRRYLRAGRPDSSGDSIAVVVAEGSIMRGDSGYSPMPLFGGDIMGSSTIARAFKAARESHPKAVIFRIDSPGGSALASEIIRLEMVRTAKEVPVVVSMGDVAASGGYWITCGANRVVADPGTITASIGVFSGHFAMERFWTEKLGVTWGKIDLDENASLYGTLDPWTQGQRATIQKFVDRIYDQFLDRVSSARKLDREQVDAMGRGRVFTGEQAKERGLVDALGGFDIALAEAKKLAKLKPDAPVDLTFFPRPKPIWQRFLKWGENESSLRETVKALAEGRVRVPGPVWMPPLEIE
jgi:protease-4